MSGFRPTDLTEVGNICMEAGAAMHKSRMQFVRPQDESQYEYKVTELIGLATYGCFDEKSP